MKKVIRLFAVCLSMVLILAACSNGAGTSSPSSAGTGSTPAENPGSASQTPAADNTDLPPEVSGDTIKIGVSIARTGTAAEVGQNCYNSLMIALDEINAAGGIMGKQVELIIEDSQNDATQAVNIAKRFIENEEVLAVTTGDSSTCNIACANYYEEAEMVLLAGTASNAGLTPLGSYIFSVAGRNTDEIPFCIKSVLKGTLGVENLGIIYANDDWGVGLKDSAQQLCSEAGITISAAEQFSVGETDYSSVLSKIRQTNPQAILVIAQYAEAGLIVNQINGMNWDITVTVTGAVVNDDFLKLVGEDAEGLVGYVGMAFVEAYPESIAFYNEYIERYNGRTPTVHSTCYEALTLLAEAANSLGDNLNRQTLRDALANAKDFQGLTGPITIEEDGNITRLYHVVQCVDGVWTKID